MAESIFNRVSRILSATVEDSIDRLERAGGEAVMREAIREAERAVDQVKAERDAVTARRLQASRQQGLVAKRVGALSDKARFAIDNGREDLAAAALSQQFDLETEIGKLEEAQAQARENETRLDEGLTALKARKTQMEEALSTYLLARRETVWGQGPAWREGAAEARVDAAEQAFARAMESAGGCGLSRADADTVNRVAEIEVLQRSAAIAERLAALKAQRAA